MNAEIEVGIEADAGSVGHEVVGKLLQALEGHNFAEVFAGITTTIDIVCRSIDVDPLVVTTRMSAWFSETDDNETEH